MLETLRKRLGRDEEEGFTLIELMVVVLIIAILIAIAIPTFLGARERAQERQAQSNLRNAFAAEKVIYTDDQAYTSGGATGAAALKSVEPSLNYYDNASISGAANNSPKDIFVHVDASGAVILGAKSKSGKCFYMKDTAAAPTTFGSNSTCVSPSTATVTATEW